MAPDCWILSICWKSAWDLGPGTGVLMIGASGSLELDEMAWPKKGELDWKYRQLESALRLLETRLDSIVKRVF